MTNKTVATANKTVATANKTVATTVKAEKATANKTVATANKTVATANKTVATTVKAENTPKHPITLREIQNRINENVFLLALVVRDFVKELVPCNVDNETIEKEYLDGLAKAKAKLLENVDNVQFAIEYADTVKALKNKRDNALNAGWGKVDATQYAVDKDFLTKAGLTTLSQKEIANEYNSLITSLNNIIKYNESIPYKMLEIEKHVVEVGTDKVEVLFKHGVYGSKKTVLATKGKEGITEKVQAFEMLNDILLK